MSNYLIGLSAGHSNMPGRDQGATGNGYIEGQLAVEFRELVAFYLKKKGITPLMDGDNTILKDTINFFRKKTSLKKYVLVDFHWNSGPPSATGTETFVPNNPTRLENELGMAFSKTTSEVLNVPMRGYMGVKKELESHHRTLGFFTLKGENALVEICFISNSSNMDSYQENKNELAENYAQILFNAANGIKLMANVGLKIEKDKFHVVRPGDTMYSIAEMYNLNLIWLQHRNNIQNAIKVGEKIYIN